MKIAILSSHAGNDIEPTVAKNLLSHLPNQVASVNEADVIVVPVSWQGDFRFNEKLHEIEKRKWCLLDFMEYGWAAGDKNNLWGTGMTHQFGHLATPEYARFDDWVRDNPPALEFKRELSKVDAATRTRMLPVEWPCVAPAMPLQSKAEFDKRPLEVFNCWGLSNPMRPLLHGDIFRNAHDHGIHVVDNFRDEGHFEKRTWATMHVPHYRRMHVNEIMRWNRRAKISVSLPGAGVKCFRSTMEAPVGSIMALPKDDLAWSYDFVDGFNCVRLDPGNLFESLECATHWDSLYSIYVESQKTVEKYRSVNYCRDYIMLAIETVL